MDIAAELIGIKLFQTKLSAFAVPSFYCGIAGAVMVFLWLGVAEAEVSTSTCRFAFSSW